MFQIFIAFCSMNDKRTTKQNIHRIVFSQENYDIKTKTNLRQLYLRMQIVITLPITNFLWLLEELFKTASCIYKCAALYNWNVFVIREEYYRIGFKDFISKLKLLFKWNMFKRPPVTKVIFLISCKIKKVQIVENKLPIWYLLWVI